jgi:hypothetical protein
MSPTGRIRAGSVRGGSTGASFAALPTSACASLGWRSFPISPSADQDGGVHLRTRNNIHIIDLTQSFMLHRALQAISGTTVAQGGASLSAPAPGGDAIADAAKKSAQYYVNSRWLAAR